ncbi:unnamed protein product [Owenia fusiformis]|uniref:Phosphatidylinositol transfer protein N-terminal domain-containing protein n=1 Tax=Owenia fusiformis TaxID=6347 RepID=A0A8S4QBG3_OWEFU|nr:unnamed protein product [Owenia fusiformis]
MLIREFRVVLPMTVEEYQVAQLYSVAEASKNETGGGEGIEVKENNPFTGDPDPKDTGPLGPYDESKTYTSGQFTHKIYHLQSKVPKWISLLAPKGSLDIVEKAWNAYPYCRTIISNPDYMKGGFEIKIETIHLPDRGETENAHGLPPDILKKREVKLIDIANDHIDSKDYKKEEDPAIYKSEKTGRGPLTKDWIKTVSPVMCAYKLVTVQFVWFGLQGRVESFIQKQEKRIFTNFHRQVFCWTDGWYGLTMEDIRALEDKTKDELDKAIKEGAVKGTKAD